MNPDPTDRVNRYAPAWIRSPQAQRLASRVDLGILIVFQTIGLLMLIGLSLSLFGWPSWMPLSDEELAAPLRDKLIAIGFMILWNLLVFTGFRRNRRWRQRLSADGGG